MNKYIFILFFLNAFQSIAQQKSNADSSASKLTLAGVYSGKNIYVQNPWADDTFRSYCTDSILVNGLRCVIDLNRSAYEINLDSIVKIQGTDIIVIIYHQKNCKPKVLVSTGFPQPRSKVEFTFFEIDTTGYVNITTKNTPTGNRPPFIIEQLRGNTWIIVFTIYQKWEVENTYNALIPLSPGKNILRLSEMQGEKLGKIITVESGIPDITCTLDPSNNLITFNDMAYFEIQTSSKLKLHSGYAKNIDISEFQNGSYILFYENQQLFFDIKRPKNKK